jgi:hypothetical protein
MPPYMATLDCMISACVRLLCFLVALTGHTLFIDNEFPNIASPKNNPMLPLKKIIVLVVT